MLRLRKRQSLIRNFAIYPYHNNNNLNKNIKKPNTSYLIKMEKITQTNQDKNAV